MNAAIETHQLAKRFGAVHAVEDLSLRVDRGEIYAFLGLNGAGKTTTIRMLLGLIRPTAGEVWICGAPLLRERRAILKRVGSLVETPSLYPHLTGWENLDVIRRMTGGTRSQVERVLVLVHLERDAHRLVREYSLGMRQRLGLALAYLGQPELLILDEPTNGLDPAGIHEVRGLIGSLSRERGVTVFVSSHLLSEVEQLATQIGIINRGHLIFQGTPEELRSRYHDRLALMTERRSETQAFLTRQGWTVQHDGNNHLNVQVNGTSDVALINAQLVRAGINVYELALVQPSLEDIFLALTEPGREERQ